MHKVQARTLTNDRCQIQAHCYRSLRRDETPQVTHIILRPDGEVDKAYCTCVAGKSGLCNHVFAVLYLVHHAVLSKWGHFKDVGTCTEFEKQ